MGSTFIRLGDRGFEANDSALEIWLVLLVREIDRTTDAPEWLREVRQEWYIQATAGFGFGVEPGLDRIVVGPERRDAILKLCADAMKNLRGYGSAISKVELNSLLGANAQNMFTEDAETEEFRKVGAYFIKLVRGDLRPEESDARIFSQRKP